MAAATAMVVMPAVVMAAVLMAAVDFPAVDGAMMAVAAGTIAISPLPTSFICARAMLRSLMPFRFPVQPRLWDSKFKQERSALLIRTMLRAGALASARS